MADITFKQVYELAKQLSSEDRAKLVEWLRATLPTELDLDYGITREQLLAEFERKKAAGEFNNVESLYGKYANPKVDVSFEEMQAYLHEIRTEWEKEIDDIISDD